MYIYIPLKSYLYSPQGKRTIGRPKKRWREQLYLWRRNGPNGPTLDVYDDDDIYIYIYFSLPCYLYVVLNCVNNTGSGKSATSRTLCSMSKV